MQALANAVDVPVWVERQNIDLKICMFDRLYQDTILVNNRWVVNILDIDGLARNLSKSGTLAMDLPQSCIEPSIYIDWKLSYNWLINWVLTQEGHTPKLSNLADKLLKKVTSNQFILFYSLQLILCSTKTKHSNWYETAMMYQPNERGAIWSM